MAVNAEQNNVAARSETATQDSWILRTWGPACWTLTKKTKMSFADGVKDSAEINLSLFAGIRLVKDGGWRRLQQ